MNLILLTTDDYIDQNKVRLTGRRQAHIRSVLRASVGQSLRVGLLNDRIGRAIVTALNDNEVELQVSLDTPPPQPLDITLILALPRPKVCRRLLQDITTLGVKEVFLLNSWKVEKSFWQSPLLTTEALQQPLHLGLEQAGDTAPPQIHLRQRFKPFVEDELPQLIANRLALIAHPGEHPSCPIQPKQPITLAIGPEGGFTPYEVDKLVATGFAPISLGRRPLRVESAVSALLGRLHPGF